MPYGKVSLQGGNVVLVVHLGYQAHPLEMFDLFTVADGDSGAFLPAVLEGLKSVVRKLGSGGIVARKINSDYPAVFLKLIVFVAVVHNDIPLPPSAAMSSLSLALNAISFVLSSGYFIARISQAR